MCGSGTGNLVGSELVIDVIDIIKVIDLILSEPLDPDSCEFLVADINGDEQLNVSVQRAKRRFLSFCLKQAHDSREHYLIGRPCEYVCVLGVQIIDAVVLSQSILGI